jgi:hypothetical protein
MNKSANQNYNYLFRYIIVGDMGKFFIKIKWNKIINSYNFSCRKIMYFITIHGQ